MNVQKLARQVWLILTRGLLHSVDDNHGIQEMSVTMLSGETRKRAERIQDYGLTSVPFEGAEAVIGHLSGTRDHPVVLRADDRRHRPQGLEDGEVELYTDEKSKVHLQRGNTIVVDSLGDEITSTVEVNPSMVQARVGPNADLTVTPATVVGRVGGTSLSITDAAIILQLATGQIFTVSPALTSITNGLAAIEMVGPNIVIRAKNIDFVEQG